MEQEYCMKWFHCKCWPYLVDSLQWRPMNIMASQITIYTIVCQQLIYFNNKKLSNLCSSMALFEVNPPWPVDPPHKGSIMWKAFPCYYVMWWSFYACWYLCFAWSSFCIAMSFLWLFAPWWPFWFLEFDSYPFSFCREIKFIRCLPVR